jgi:TolB-like protein/Tfp pilus assembly protein PilF/predicted Ser/Thr protein kinase
MPLASGTKLGPFEIETLLGAGGMGEVYKATDTRLGRSVAIKILKTGQLERFQVEARAIAALNHPNICALHDVGSDFLVMEYVEGQPLRGPLPTNEALRIALEISGAVEAAHNKGIIHRDLKPANILVSQQGVKLLDFGLAKAVQALAPQDETLPQTLPGTLMGTIAYMSPEQAQGKTVDVRSDIFSFGVVVYELLSGRRPFLGDTQSSTLAAILVKEPPPLQVPREFGDIVMHCLRKPPADRYQTMAEVRRALEQVSLHPRVPHELHEQQPSIAVLPFANMSADRDNEYFSDGLAEEIINLLAHIPTLKVIARSSAFAFKGKNEDVRRIAETLGVAHVLEGGVRKAGNRIRVTAQLISAADGCHLWSERYDREMADVFAIQDEIASAIAGALRVKISGKPKYTPELPAYEAVLRGRYYRQKLTQDAHRRTHECFEQAASLDSGYAAPHAELGLNYLLSSTNGARSLREVTPLIRAEALKALELDPFETNPHALLGAIAATHDYQWSEAARHFEMAMSSASVSAETRWAYASFYLQPLGRFRESVTEMRRAVEEDPLNVSWRSILASHLNLAQRNDEAREELLKALEIDENHWLANCILGQIYMATGQYAEAAAAAEKAHRVNSLHSMPSAVLAAALVQLGEKDRATEVVSKIGDSPKPIWGRVEYHLYRSEVDAAADWYEKMIEQREPFAVIYARSSLCKDLRQSPRWPGLARKINLPAVAP